LTDSDDLESSETDSEDEVKKDNNEETAATKEV